MPTPLVWQLEAEDAGFTATLDRTAAAAQAWASGLVTTAERVGVATGSALRGAAPMGGAGDLAALPAQAQAATTALRGLVAAQAAEATQTTEAARALTAFETAVAAFGATNVGFDRSTSQFFDMAARASGMAAPMKEYAAAETSAAATATTLADDIAVVQSKLEVLHALLETKSVSGGFLADTERQIAELEPRLATLLAQAQGAGGGAGGGGATAGAQQLSEALATAQTRLATLQALLNTPQVSGAFLQDVDRQITTTTQEIADLEAQLAGLPPRTKEAAAGLATVGTAAERAGAQAQTAGEGVSSLVSHIGNLLVNQAVYAALNALQRAAGGLMDTLFSKPKIQEDALAVYTVELGNAAAAQARFTAVQTESLRVGLPLADLLTLDEHLAQLGVTAETAQQRFGRSLPQIRQDLADLASVPGMDVSKVDEFFTRGAEGANRLVLSLATAGLASREELQAIGVEFAGTSNNIISTSNVTASALLTLTETKFQGMAAAHAQTMDGIQTRTASAWDRIGQTLGKDVFAAAKVGARDFLAILEDPKALTAADNLGTHLGDTLFLIELGFRKTAEAANTLFGLMGASNLLGDPSSWQSLGAWTDFVHQRLQAIRDAYAPLDAAGTAAGQGIGTAMAAAGQGADATKERIDRLTSALDRAKLAASDLQAEEAARVAPLQASLDASVKAEAGVTSALEAQKTALSQQATDLRDAATAAHAAIQPQIDAQQASLTRLQRAAEDIRAAYEKQVQPIKDQETALDRVYQRQQDIRGLADAQNRLAADRALAQDIYSPEGRAAAARLPGEEAAAAAAQAQLTQHDTKAGLEDQVTQAQRLETAALATNQTQQRTAQDLIASLQAADKAQQAIYTRQETSLQTRIRALDGAITGEKAVYDAIQGHLQDQITAIKTTYQTLTDGFTAQEAVIQHSIDVLQKGAAFALTTTLENAKTVLFTIQMAAAVLDGNRQPGISPPAPSLEGPVESGASGSKIVPLHRALGGPVGGSAGEWFTVGERGPEVLHAGGVGTVLPSGGAPTTITLILQDPDGHRWFQDQWASNEAFVTRQIRQRVARR